MTVTADAGVVRVSTSMTVDQTIAPTPPPDPGTGPTIGGYRVDPA